MRRDAAYYSRLQNMSALDAMTLLAPESSGDNGALGVNDNSLGNISNTSVTAIQREGAAQVLQLALYHGFTHFLSEAIAMVEQDIRIRVYQFNLWTLTSAAISDGGADGDVKQRQERGDIAWEAWLLNQAGAYFTAPPGRAANMSIQGLMENFTYTYVEQLVPGASWQTTGYNKEIAQGLHPAAMLGIYGIVNFSALYPKSYAGFSVLWNGMLAGPLGSYEPDNTPSYANFNLGMVLSMGLWLNRLVRPAGNNSTSLAYISDSFDVPRVLDNFLAETMPNGNSVNYNKAIYTWKQRGSGWYAYNSAEDTASWNLKMGYLIFGKTDYLYVARLIEQFQITTNVLSATLLDEYELFPAGVQSYGVVGLQTPASFTGSSVTYFRTSALCYDGSLMCRGATQATTVLVPNKLVLRAGQSAYMLISVTGDGEHANEQQQATVENTIVNNVYVVARAARPYQVNQCNCILILASNLTFPDFDSSNFNGDTGLPADDVLTNPSVVQGAITLQIDSGTAYGQVTFSQYLYPSYSATRQVVLLSSGATIVVDTLQHSNTSTTVPHANGGLTYRLWPGVIAHGTNWAVQSVLYGINSTNFLPSPSTNCTLFYIASGSGRSFGMRTEPLSDWLSNNAGQTLATMYAYDSLSDLRPHSFVSIMLPMPCGSNFSAVVAGISFRTGVDGTTNVSLPSYHIVTVPRATNFTIYYPVGLVLWLSATSLPNGAAGPIAFWRDSSSNNYTVTQTVESRQPTLVPTGMNGHRALHFNGSIGQWLNAPAIFPCKMDYTIITLATYTGGYWLLGQATSGFEFGHHQSFQVLNNGASSNQAQSNTSVPVNKPVLLSVTYSASTSTLRYFIGGAAAGNATMSPVTSTSILQIGCYTPQATQCWSGLVSEVMLYNYSLPDSSRRQQEQAILVNYGLASSGFLSASLPIPLTIHS